MKAVTVITEHGLIRGLWNVKAGLVSYIFEGHAEYVCADRIVSAF